MFEVGQGRLRMAVWVSNLASTSPPPPAGEVGRGPVFTTKRQRARPKPRPFSICSPSVSPSRAAPRRHCQRPEPRTGPDGSATFSLPPPFPSSAVCGSVRSAIRIHLAARRDCQKSRSTDGNAQGRVRQFPLSSVSTCLRDERPAAERPAC